MTVEVKSMVDFEVTSASKGEVEATFATLNTVDLDNDVTVAGAFREGQAVAISQWQHGSWDSGKAPAGKGRIHVVGDEARMRGRFLLSTTPGRETFDLVSSLAEDGLPGWSYGFDILDYAPGTWGGRKVRLLKRLHVFEVSPVMRPAGVGTRTISAKGDDADREAALVEKARFLDMKVADLRQRLADLQREEAEAIREHWERQQVLDIKAALRL
jgi:Caudovirus prohead serine protease